MRPNFKTIMTKHIVIFKFRGTPEERLATARLFKQKLDELPTVVPQLKSIEVGININPAEANDLVLTAVADSLEDVAVYSAHPAHVAAVAAVKERIEARACVDYSI